jgi:filamentous hemagglutinin
MKKTKPTGFLARLLLLTVAAVLSWGNPLRAESPVKEPARPAVPAVPGGGLAAHEKAGGHLLRRHVGKSEEDLVERLESQPGIRSASSFPDRRVAETVVGLVIASRQKEIARWLRGDDERLTLDFTANRPVGIMVSRRSMRAEPVHSVRLVLERDAEFEPLGWRILTGYPQK